MANWYVDYVNGSDTNDGFTIVTPKKTIQAAVNVATLRDVIHLADSGNHVLTAPLTWNTGFTNTGGGYLIFKAWAAVNSGGQTIQRPDETTPRAAALIDGLDTISGMLSFGPPPIVAINLKLTNFTSYPIDPYGGGPLVMIGCEIYGQSGSQRGLITRGLAYITNLYMHSNTTTQRPIELNDGNTSYVVNSWIESSAHALVVEMDNLNNFTGNIVKLIGPSKRVINITNNLGLFTNNTIISDGSSGHKVIEQSGQNVGVTYNNLIYNFTGSGSVPFNITGISSSRIFGRNAFYNCNASVFQTEGYVGIDLTSEDINLSGDPFIDSANNDYRLDPIAGAAAIGAGLGNYSSAIDIGAFQSTSSGGGGGSNIFIINE